MAFTKSNDHLTGRKPAVYPAGAEVVAVRSAIDLVAADLDANDVGALPSCQLAACLWVWCTTATTWTPTQRPPSWRL